MVLDLVPAPPPPPAPPPAPAQMLPYFILDNIIEYAADFNSLKNLSTIRIARSRIPRLVQLAQICSRWRQVMLKFLCKDLSAYFVCYEDFEICDYRLWPVPGVLDYTLRDTMVKTVRIIIDYCVIGNYRILEKMDKPYFASRVCPNATTLNLVISDCMMCKRSNRPDEPNMSAEFIKAIKKVMPNVQRVNFESKAANTMVDDTVAYTFKALPHVFQEIKKSSCHLFAQSQIDGLSSTAITGLALFEFDGDIEEDNILEFIHRNSPTLEELKINEIANGVVSDLAFTCAGEPAVFPRLRRLHLKRSVDSRPHFDEVETVTTVVFPELKWVTLEMEYPFNDDTLFRGNVATMQYLDMQVDKRSIDILTKHNVFTPERGRTLQSLCLKVPESAQTMSAKTLARVSEFATESLSSPRRLCIDSIDISKHVLRVSALKNTCMYGLRELSIPCTKLSLSELASLLGALPYLLELGYECTELEDDLASVPPGELPSCVQRKYSPLSRHLKTVNYSTADTEKTAAVATYAMLMAIICPRLTLVTVANSIYKSYRDYIDHAKAQAPFDAYAAQIAVLEKKKALVIEMPRF